MYGMLTCLQMNVTTLYAVDLNMSYSWDDYFFLFAPVPYKGIIVSSSIEITTCHLGTELRTDESCNAWSKAEIIKRKGSKKLHGKSWAGNGLRLAEMSVLRRTTPNAIIHRIINGEDLTKREREGNGWFGSWKSHPPLYVSRHVKAKIVTAEKLRTDSKREL